MAQATWLQLVSGEEIQELRRNPSGVNHLDKPDCYRTHFGATLNYFLTGKSYPSPEHHELAPMLFGAESVACATLENGYFGVVSSDVAARIAARLATVDLTGVETAVGHADFDDLMDEYELYELELVTPEEAAGVIVAELEALVDFYAEAQKSGLGVVTYTT